LKEVLPEKEQWDDHWQILNERQSAFGLIARFVRRGIFQPAVRYYAEKCFPETGIFVEMGCGTAESSALIPARRRRLCGLDFSLIALQTARRGGYLSDLAAGDLLTLPFRDCSITGIWNLGVMEHFPHDTLLRVLSEFRRVLEPGGIALLFWPTEFNSSRWILGPIERVRSALGGRQFRFFPDEVSRLRSMREAIQLLKATGFEVIRTDFSIRTAYIHMVVVARRADT
jgi:SAM-dependent methyltransferase